MVSIPNGKPGPLRLGRTRRQIHQRVVSIPNGKPGPLRRRMAFDALKGVGEFQSQTGSQALSDAIRARPAAPSGYRFNPKREARPSQTDMLLFAERANKKVSIPNGKPGPLRRGLRM